MAIHHLPSGRWQADHWYTDSEGKKKRRRKSFTTKNEAKAWESNKRAAKNTALQGSAIRSIRFIEEAIEYFESTPEFIQCLPETQRQYSKRLIQWKVWCDAQGIYSLNEFTKDIARRYVGFVVKKYKGYGIDMRLRLVKTVINYELDRDNPTIVKNPFWKIKTSGYAKQSDAQFLPRETISWVLEHATPKEKAIVQILYNTAMRSAELHTLAWKEVLKDRIILLASKTKVKRARAIPLNKSAKEGLDYFRKITGGERYVLIGPNPAHKTYLQIVFKRMVSRLKKITGAPDLSEFTPHALRRSLASHALQGGARIEDVSGVLGHADIRITKRAYATLTIENLRGVVEGIDTA